MKCFVTGSAGFIGSALINKLSSEGYDIIGLYHKNIPKFRSDNVIYYRGDIKNIDSINKAIKDVDIVFHCAALLRDYGRKKDFLKTNFEGTKNLVKLCKKYNIKKFVYLSHFNYKNVNKISYYSKSKKMAEKYLVDQNIHENFPCIIIQPGNVYGPGESVWVLFPLEAIKKNRIALIDKGNGIFLHTYIDNLVDALVKTIDSKKAIGKIIQITDGDNNITWGDYLNHLSNLAGKSHIKSNISLRKAFIIAKLMDYLNRLFHIKPILSPTSVSIFSNKKKVSVKNANNILDYKPRINYEEGMKRVESWLREEGYIN